VIARVDSQHAFTSCVDRASLWVLSLVGCTALVGLTDVPPADGTPDRGAGDDGGGGRSSGHDRERVVRECLETLAARCRSSASKAYASSVRLLIQASKKASTTRRVSAESDITSVLSRRPASGAWEVGAYVHP
jgi:hypothetical protein